MGTEAVESAVLRGFRAFKVAANTKDKTIDLVGQHGNSWHGATLQATCDNIGKVRAVSFAIQLEELHATNDPYQRCALHLQADICSCGIYSFNSVDEVLRQYTARAEWAHVRENVNVDVVAECVLWGATIEGTRGQRSEWARIEALNILQPKVDTCPECKQRAIISSRNKYSTGLNWMCDYTTDRQGYAEETRDKVLRHLVARYEVPTRYVTVKELREAYNG